MLLRHFPELWTYAFHNALSAEHGMWDNLLDKPSPTNFVLWSCMQQPRRLYPHGENPRQNACAFEINSIEIASLYLNNWWRATGYRGQLRHQQMARGSDTVGLSHPFEAFILCFCGCCSDYFHRCISASISHVLDSSKSAAGRLCKPS